MVPSMGFQEIIGLLALNVAIVATILSIAMSSFNKKLAQQKDDILAIRGYLEVLEDEENRLNEIVRSIIQCYLIDDACEGSYESVIERILNENNTDKDTLKRIVAVFDKNRTEKIRVVNELLLWSKDRKAKESAFRNLSEASGNHESVTFMQEAMKYDPGKGDGIYTRSIEALLQRLNNLG